MVTRLGPAIINVQLNTKFALGQIESLMQRVVSLNTLTRYSENLLERTFQNADKRIEKLSEKAEGVGDGGGGGRGGRKGGGPRLPPLSRLLTGSVAAGLALIPWAGPAAAKAFETAVEFAEVGAPIASGIVQGIAKELTGSDVFKKEIGDLVNNAIELSLGPLEKLRALEEAIKPTITGISDLSRVQAAYGDVNGKELLDLGQTIFSVNNAQADLSRQRRQLERELGGSAVGEVVGEQILKFFGGGQSK